MQYFSLDNKQDNYRQIKPGEIISILAVSHLQNNLILLKPILVYYNNTSNQFLTIDNSIPVIPFNSNYSLPGWQDLFNPLLSQNILTRVKSNVEQYQKRN